jgi:PAS domain S-box-containing protein
MVLIASINMAFQLHQARMSISAQKREIETTYQDLRAAMKDLEAAHGELVKTQKEIFESEKRFRLLVEGNPDVFYYIHDSEHVFEYVSPSVKRILGYLPEEIVGRPYEDFLAGDESDALVKKLTDGAISDGRRRPVYNTVCRHRDGSRVVMEINEVPMMRDGRISGMQGFAQDVTERIRLEETLRDSRTMMDQAQELAKFGSWEWNAVTGHYRWSQGMYEIFGVDPSVEPTVRLVHDLIHPEDVHMYDRAAVSLFESLRRTRNQEYRILTPDGAVKWVVASARALRGENGKIERAVGFVQDITERKRAEAELHINELRLQTLVELGHMHDASLKELMDFVLESAVNMTGSRIGYFAFVSEDEKTLTMHSWSKNAMAHCRIAEKPIVYPLETTGLWGEAVRQRRPVITNDYAAANPLKKGYPEGHVAVKSHMNVPIFDGDRIVIVAGVGNKEERYNEHDVRQLTLLMEGMWRILRYRRTQEALRESEIRFRDLVDLLPVGIYEADGKTRLTYANRTALDMFGLAMDEIREKGIRYLDLITPESLKLYGTAGYRITRESPMIGAEYQGIRRNGETFPLFISACFIDAGNPSRGTRGIVMDLSERKRSEEEIRLRTEMMEGITRSLPGVVYRFYARQDGSMGLYYVSDQASDIFGLSPDQEGFFETFTACVHPEDRGRFLESISDAVRAVVQWDFEGRFVKPSGSTIWFRGQSVPSPRGSEIVFNGLLLDVTARRETEDRLLQAHRMESVGRLAAGVAHDFNNLLTPIIGYSEMLLSDLHPSDERFEQAMEIRKAAERSRELARQMLSFGRKQVLQVRPIDINAILTGIERMMRRVLREDITLAVEPCGLPCAVMADPGQMEMALMNLAVNAQDAMPGGGTLTLGTELLQVDCAVETSTGPLPPGRYVMVRVTDTGHGMDEETRLHAFEPFFSTKGNLGTGLGLSTVYGTVLQHGGRIALESAPGSGSTVRIYLPHMETEVPAETAEKPAWSGPAREAGALLLAEDNDTVRKLTCAILEKGGYSVTCAGNGKEALEELERLGGSVVLLVTDVVMPDMNGRELYRAALSRYPHLKVLYMSGYAEDLIADRGLLDPGVSLIQKPFTVQSLLSMARKVIEGG